MKIAVALSLALLVLLPACSEDPPDTGTARFRSQAKTSACISWCERERAEGCQDASPRLDDCAAYCAGPPGCGDAGPLLACVEQNPGAIGCDGGKLRYAPACVVEAKRFDEGADPCEDDAVDVASKNPR